MLELGGRVHRKKEKFLDLGVVENIDEEILEGLPPGALKRARSTLQLLSKHGVLSACDAEPFARYVQHLRIVYEADQILRDNEVISYDKNGVPHKHPALQIHRDNSQAALRYEEQFGLTPAARVRLRGADEIREDREVSAFNEFIAVADEQS